MSDNGRRYRDETPEIDEDRGGNGVKVETENGGADYEDGSPQAPKGRGRRRSPSGSIKDRSRSRSLSKTVEIASLDEAQEPSSKPFPFTRTPS